MRAKIRDMRHITSCCFIFFSLVLAGFSRAGSLEIVHGDESNPIVKVAQLIMTDVYGRLGYDVRFIPRPLKRAVEEANDGDYDAEVARVGGLEERYPNLIRVPVPIYAIRGVVFSKRADFSVVGWESLKPYKVGVLRGVQFADKGTRGLDRSCANSLLALFRMLDTGRVDVVVEARLNGLITLRRLKLQDAIRILEPPLMTLELFHYVHRKNERLIPDMTALLERMKLDGSLDALILQSERRVIEAVTQVSDTANGGPCEDDQGK